MLACHLPDLILNQVLVIRPEGSGAPVGRASTPYKVPSGKASRQFIGQDLDASIMALLGLRRRPSGRSIRIDQVRDRWTFSVPEREGRAHCRAIK